MDSATRRVPAGTRFTVGSGRQDRTEKWSPRDLTLNQLYIAFNTRSEHLRDARVRRALALAYDYQGHIEHLMRGNAEPAYGVLPGRAGS